MEFYPVIGLGLMSGTSLDGLDLALVRFENESRYRILASQLVAFPETLRQRLVDAPRLSGLELSLLDVDYGAWMANESFRFIQNQSYKPDFIASHGYTVHHLPAQGLSLQIGNPAVIAAHSGFPVVGNFRQGDVALGGQGAPLVPAAEPMLFPQYQAWLNLGGIANLTYYDDNWQLRAHDVAPCNQILNKLANIAGFPFDEDGKIARTGQPIPSLLNELGKLPHYQPTLVKPSLGREWVEEFEWPVYEKFISHPVENLLASAVLHLAGVISETLMNSRKQRDQRILVTGGGAHHTLLMALIGQLSNWQVEKPGKELIDFKEALVFAWLGMKRLQEQPNTITSVTGAHQPISAGGLYLPGFNSTSTKD